jgi:AcrR family transcriptional regulator
MAQAPLSRRDQNKLEKRGRIIAAARAFFAQKGFEATTIQDIADAAGVSVGTVFLYAKAKEDLLILVFHDEMTGVIEQAYRVAVQQAGLVDQLCAFFEAEADYHERDLPLARALMRKLGYVDSAEQRESVTELMTANYTRLAMLIEAAKTRGEVGAAVPLLPAARSVFACYYLHLGGFLSGYIDRDRFNRTIREHFELLLKGLGAG